MGTARGITDIRTALVEFLKTIQAGETYANSVPVDHIYTVFDKSHFTDTEDKLYPKFFLVTLAGENAQKVSSRYIKKNDFALVVVVKKVKSTDDPQLMLESWMDDIELMFDTQTTLGGAVAEVHLTDFTMDGGYSHPEGVAVVTLHTVRHVQR